MPPLSPSEGRCEVGRYYLLPEDTVVEEPHYAKWTQWYESSYDKDRRWAVTKQVTVSFGQPSLL